MISMTLKNFDSLSICDFSNGDVRYAIRCSLLDREKLLEALKGLVDSHAEGADFPAVNNARSAITEAEG
ncbi:hypothetical protein LCGC14_2446070 [marine sediment metagenome]|uniref:Uncharacterized protein n=1 Tax=marine sediment metagenome TaxID=412755 RepID=A0A0F9EBD9_9ZZZZ